MRLLFSRSSMTDFTVYGDIRESQSTILKLSKRIISMISVESTSRQVAC